MINYILSILVFILLVERIYFYYKQSNVEKTSDAFSLQICKSKQEKIEKENYQIKQENKKIETELERVRNNHKVLHRAMNNQVENNKELIRENKKLMKNVKSLLARISKLECFLNTLLGNDWKDINPETINSDKLRKIIKNFMENNNDNNTITNNIT